MQRRYTRSAMSFKVAPGLTMSLLWVTIFYGQGRSGSILSQANSPNAPGPATARSGTASPQLPVNSPLRTPLSTAGKWHNFVRETVNPLTLGAGIFNGGLSHITNSDPRYGTNSAAFAQRFGASVADVATQNFFGDFLLASAFHEDPRYVRMGPQNHLLSRVAYAISRAVVIRTDAGGSSFNYSNVVGSAMSAGLSNAYYPPASRTSGAIIIHFVSSVAGAGFANLAPEFWPDFKEKIFKRHG